MNIELKLLGSPQILADGKPVVGLTSLKSQALLFYIALRPEPHSRTLLSGLLWPEKSDDEARVNLRQCVRLIRKVLPDAVVATRESLRVNYASFAQYTDADQPTPTVDVLIFEQLLRDMGRDDKNVAKAISLYDGEFLAGLYLADAPEFESWQLAQRERLRQLVIGATERLVDQAGDPQMAIAYSRKLLELEPWRESGYQKLMRLLAADGQHTAALKAFSLCQQVLNDELGVEPSRDLLALFQRIEYARDHRHDNLPRPDTALLGRRAALEQVESMLANGDRFLTIMGPGGMGKTRFGLEAAHLAQFRFLDGVCWLELADISNGRLLPQLLADQLQWHYNDDRQLEQQLLDFLSKRHLLLVFDNFEHLVHDSQAVGFLQKLWRKAADCVIVVTTRVRLRLQAERLVTLGPLSFPQQPIENIESARSKYPAVDVFLSTAARIGIPKITDLHEIRAVGEICRALEGLPLAIEMAAALLYERTAEQILAAITENMRSLVSDFYDVPERQQSLWATFQYSLDLLSDEEQNLLLNFTIFSGEFSLKAAEVIANGTSAGMRKLANHSLLTIPAAGRFYVHAVVRDMAMTLRSSHSVPSSDLELRIKHATYYLRLAGQHGKALRDENGPKAREWFVREFKNIVLAWRNGINADQTDLLYEALPGLTDYSHQRGLYATLSELLLELHDSLGGRDREPQISAGTDILLLRAVVSYEFSFAQMGLNELDLAKRSLDEAYELITKYNENNDSRVLLLGKIFLGYAELAQDQGDYSAALAAVEQAFKHIGPDDFAQRARAYRNMASAKSNLGQLDEAIRWSDQAKEAVRQIEDTDRYAGILNSRGLILARAGRLREARQQHSTAAAMAIVVGNVALQAAAHNNEGIVHDLLGEYRQSQKSYQAAYELLQHSETSPIALSALMNLGRVSHLIGQYEEAWRHYQNCLAAHQQAGNRFQEALCLTNLSLLAHNRNDQHSAIAYAESANLIGQRLDSSMLIAYARMFEGHALTAQKQWSAAAGAYAAALKFAKLIGVVSLMADIQAGQARLALAQGDEIAAMSHIEPVLDFLQKNSEGQGSEEPIRLFLTAYEVLAACSDKRAAERLDAGRVLLLERADRLYDEQLREQYLTRVVVHHKLLNA